MRRIALEYLKALDIACDIASMPIGLPPIYMIFIKYFQVGTEEEFLRCPEIGINGGEQISVR